jgi:DNA polymerase-3 subunit epsilon
MAAKINNLLVLYILLLIRIFLFLKIFYMFVNMEAINKINIDLEKPIIFFDLESTGIEINEDQIVEICAVKYMPDGTTEKYYSLVKPTCRIRPEAIAVHHITEDKVENAPFFKDIAQDVFNFFDGCDLGGYNLIRFDVPMLIEELFRCQIKYNPLKYNIIDVYKIIQEMEPRNLTTMYRMYTGKDLENAHTAEADIYATIAIFEKQIERYTQVDGTIKAWSNITRSLPDGYAVVDFQGNFKHKDGKYYYNFGKKHKNEEVTLSNIGYLDWMINGQFSCNTRNVARLLKDKIKKDNGIPV